MGNTDYTARLGSLMADIEGTGHDWEFVRERHRAFADYYADTEWVWKCKLCDASGTSDDRLNKPYHGRCDMRVVKDVLES